MPALLVEKSPCRFARTGELRLGLRQLSVHLGAQALDLVGSLEAASDYIPVRRPISAEDAG